MLKMVPWEVWHGQRLNVNRWLGNGRDDSSPRNGVVDEPNEADAGEAIWPVSFTGGFGASTTFPSGVPFNYVNDDPVFEDNSTPTRYARQILARHLYCMMMFLADQQTPSNPGGYLHPIQETPNVPLQRELTAQRIAQWAINVVDFRDSDAIMSPFEYDADPFDGWQDIDGNPTTVEPGERRIVWGAEYPDLLLSETGAFHDRRVKDTDRDNGDMTKRDDASRPDNDLDQFRIPQGSLFVEMYCTRNDRYERNTGSTPPPITREVPPQELYDGYGRLDLGRLAPKTWNGTAPLGRGRQPVWRLAISERHDGASNNSPLDLHENAPDSTTFEPPRIQADRPPLNLERYAWFAPLDPDDVCDPAEANKTFYGQSGTWDPSVSEDVQSPTNVRLLPGHYAVIGPRTVTTIGSAIVGDGDPATIDPSAQRVDITLPPPVPAQPTLGLVIAANPPPPTEWVDQNRRIGLNLSEPLPRSGNYYLEPTHPGDAYGDLAAAPPAYTLPDQPFDQTGPLSSDPDGPGPRSPDPDGLKTGTRLNYKTVFLQRLADPLLPWNPLVGESGHDSNAPVNPYITVDWAAVDLTVFSGEEDTNRQVTNPDTHEEEWLDKDDPDAVPPIINDEDPFGSDPDERFNCRERGDRTDNARNVWRPTTTDPATTAPSAIDAYFSHPFGHTLGYLNSTMGAPTASAANYEGAPDQPFPWLTWNNRPYANPLELMLVPSSTPARLLHEFDIVRSTTTTDPYDSAPGAEYLNFKGTFPHLLNFFHTSEWSQTGSPPVDTLRRGADFYRIFDYVETPSPFVGAEKWYYPVQAALTAGFRPPYNSLSRFRDPGRVNINTIFDMDVWEGITKGYPFMDPTSLGADISTRIFTSRRGYAGGLLDLDSDYPTLFGNPFREADSADLMPDVGVLRKKEPVQATLLREDDILPRTEGLFVPDPANPPQCQDQDRNPFFRYQGLARLSNLVSSNSNVFAVWITLGYFEVESNPTGVDVAHRDGLRLGRELGSDTGVVKRHRAFYIIDRSVPVAFEPGENHNVDRAIMLRRFIE